MRPQLELASLIVDDERIEEPERIHADQKSGLMSQMPMLEDPHLAVGDLRTPNLDPAHHDGWTHEHLPALHGRRDIKDLIRRPLSMTTHESGSECLVADSPLSAGVDHRVHPDSIYRTANHQ